MDFNTVISITLSVGLIITFAYMMITSRPRKCKQCGATMSYNTYDREQCLLCDYNE